MTQVDVIVFDLDDTLFPERDFVLGGFRAVSDWLQQHWGVTGFFEAAWALFNTGTRDRIFDRTLDRFDIPYTPDLIRRLVQIYRDHSPELMLFPDAQWALDFYCPQRKLGLITNGYLRTQKNKVQALGIADRFDALLYCDQFGREHWKPSPLAYQKLMESLSCDGAACVYIGDHAEKDFIAPKQLGWHTIRIQRRGGEFETLRTTADQDAEFCVSSLYDLDPLLNELQP